ncbi:hypothetical protein ADUPG1_008883 [Aduncisulcus paluster]|uniref:Uncharacterized protein n=1 Tax=Aduncisulcus paluster TaxID=2918883 RepID=A0ABQ5KWG2_9EUKA|nr:hypothetical protein ADUPG1_008883 [Aduncisulcus paluster]
MSAKDDEIIIKPEIVKWLIQPRSEFIADIHSTVEDINESIDLTEIEEDVLFGSNLKVKSRRISDTYDPIDDLYYKVIKKRMLELTKYYSDSVVAKLRDTLSPAELSFPSPVPPLPTMRRRMSYYCERIYTVNTSRIGILLEDELKRRIERGCDDENERRITKHTVTIVTSVPSKKVHNLGVKFPSFRLPLHPSVISTSRLQLIESYGELDIEFPVCSLSACINVEREEKGEGAKRVLLDGRFFSAESVMKHSPRFLNVRTHMELSPEEAEEHQDVDIKCDKDTLWRKMEFNLGNIFFILEEGRAFDDNNTSIGRKAQRLAVRYLSDQMKSIRQEVTIKEAERAKLKEKYDRLKVEMGAINTPSTLLESESDPSVGKKRLSDQHSLKAQEKQIINDKLALDKEIDALLKRFNEECEVFIGNLRSLIRYCCAYEELFIF